MCEMIGKIMNGVRKHTLLPRTEEFGVALMHRITKFFCLEDKEIMSEQGLCQAITYRRLK